MFRRTVLACSALLAVSVACLAGSPVRAASAGSGACTSTVGSATNVSVTMDADAMCIIQFKNVGSTTWTVPADITEAEVFVVGGGGAGAWSDVYAQGGGGGGGIAHKTGLAVSGTWTITVGAGGTGTNSPRSWTSGSASSVSNGSATITADGGGAGAGWGGAVGFTGGSGGGGHWYNSCCDKGVATRGSASGVTGTVFHGNDGGNSNFAHSGGGGGGGASSAGTAGTAGQVGGDGGEGLSSTISGSTVVYGSGGSGIGVNGGGTPGTGAGRGYTSAQGGDGAANTGAGGGAGAFAYRSGHGASGIVIVKYGPVATAPANSAVPTVSGTTTNGQTLTAVRGTWSGSPAPTYAYRWKRATSVSGSYTNITGATALSYTLTDDDIDAYLKFEVTATNSSATVTALSAATARIADMVRPTTTTTSTTSTTSTTTTVVAPATTAPSLIVNVSAPPTTSATIPSLTATTVTTPVIIPVATTFPLRSTAAAAPVATSTSVPTTTTTVVPVPRAASVVSGQAAMTVGDKSITPTVERRDNKIVITAGEYRASLASVDSNGKVAPLDADGNVRLATGQRVQVNASGFEPGSIVEVWLFSTPRKLGEMKVDKAGTVSGTFEIPAGLPAGSHRMVIVARGADAKETSLTVGVTIGEWKKSKNIATWLIVLPIVLAVAGALTLPATRRRRAARVRAQ